MLLKKQKDFHKVKVDPFYEFPSQKLTIFATL